MNHKRILFIAPATEFGAYPPLGILSVASYIREKGYEVGIIDYSGLKISKEQIKQDISNFNPDLVALGVLTGPGLTRAIMVSDIAKSLGKTVVWGGPHPTILPNLTLSHPSIDAVIMGEGEYALEEYLGYLNGSKKEPKGIGLKINNKIKITPPQDRFVDIEKKPMPAWELIKDIDKYFPYSRHNFVLLEANRGCPYRCGFCHHANNDVKEYGGKFRNLSAVKLIEQFDYVRSLTKKHISRMDIGGDMHLTNEAFTEKFVKEMLDSGRKIGWHTVSRFDCMTEKMADMIAKAGCEGIMLGCESGSPRIQKMLGKRIDLEKAKKVAKRIRDNGIMLTITYMMGHPDETLEEIKMTKKFMKEIPADQNLLQIYRPFPGTPYFNLSIQQKKTKLPSTLKDYVTFGVLGHHANISKVSSAVLLREFYRTNAYEQTRYFINQQRFFLKKQMYHQFLDLFKNNKFTFKIKEMLTVSAK
ncbi:B12-binding domain-containing radical SAM protein [Candidatus Woesearchaeota archaeon]|nr:B12-binding domain-containing radical SAM protein [Candidatus Woesearchaeota archaeon]